MKINSGNKRHVHTESDAKKEASGKSRGSRGHRAHQGRLRYRASHWDVREGKNKVCFTESGSESGQEGSEAGVIRSHRCAKLVFEGAQNFLA